MSIYWTEMPDFWPFNLNSVKAVLSSWMKLHMILEEWIYTWLQERRKKKKKWNIYDDNEEKIKTMSCYSEVTHQYREAEWLKEKDMVK